jgi:rubrerythrin
MRNLESFASAFIDTLDNRAYLYYGIFESTLYQNIRGEGKQMPKTEAYLKEAFAGESQANRKYLAYAAKADQEGFPQAARLFRAAAEAETVHAHNHLRALKAIGGTKENLADAVKGETHEFKKMYPEMIAAAKAEGKKDAERSFSYANEVEKIHAQLYQKLLDGLGGAQENYPYYVCPVCGYTAERKPPDTCPVCGTKGEMFKKTD